MAERIAKAAGQPGVAPQGRPYEIVGSVYYNSATPPCYICGFGTTCKYGGPARWMTPEEFEKFDKITPDMFKNFEDDPAATAACDRMGAALAEAVKK
jgi:hypothetical protein